MKKNLNIIKLIAFPSIILMLIGVCSCKKHNDSNTDTFQKNESFYMYINGKYWEPKRPSSITSSYVPDDPAIRFYPNDSILIIIAGNSETDEIILFSAKIYQIGNYNLKKDWKEIYSINTNNDTLIAQYKTRFDNNQGFSKLYFLTDSINSQILITKFDTIKENIAGKFYMFLVNSENDTLYIDNGSFNYEYLKIY